MKSAELRVDLQPKERDVLDDFLLVQGLKRGQIIEQRIRLVVRPRPSWMPGWLWRRLLARMLVIEEHSPVFK